ncbi:response regulator transcription factor [Psychromarinibacter sp. C21-152]|uniref:Response regulator transcription factor n=1 Tax=Psychromarinibacter sediminicola TaxID=3033385 RepID=A0AAE3NTL9_9RHOB|nr:response regulator transcription factor [Psychromarinibacter sediminicola]MDF0602209.1 response regulator transcription factor [Psychromarinibacter sediminicola]
MYHVLCLYESDEDQQFVADALDSYGLKTTCVGCSAKEQALMQSVDFDLFILDIRHLDGSGLDLIPQIRRQNGKAGIIILTAIDDETDRVLGLELGADDFLVSPISARELLARAKAILRRTRPQESPGATGVPWAQSGEIVFHGLVLRPNARSLREQRSAQPVELTNAEFDVLSVLAQHRNRAMTRDEILHAIRGSEWEANDRFVDGIVSRLRRKLYAERGREEQIKTIRGVGYMLTD